MSVVVDFNNKDVIRYIDEVLALPSTNPRSPHVQIPRDQLTHYQWAKAYEELEPIVSDAIYDMHTRYLQRQQMMFPDIWDEVSLTCFQDGSWQFTGMFIEQHDPEDEEWII